MSGTRDLLRTGRPPVRRVCLSVALGSLAALAGVGLLSLAGYLISRSAEHPPVLELTVAIVAGRPVLRAPPVARPGIPRPHSHAGGVLRAPGAADPRCDAWTPAGGFPGPPGRGCRRDAEPVPARHRPAARRPRDRIGRRRARGG